MKTILTLKYGEKYSAADVNRIVNDTGRKYNYACITDDPTDIDPIVKIIQLPEEVEGHWIKIWMYTLEGLGDTLYLDLDVRIQKNIDHLWNYLDIYPTIAYTYWKNKEFPEYDYDSHGMRYLSNYNSSIVMWKEGTTQHIWDQFERNSDYYMVKYFGDDRFLWHEDFRFNRFPKGEIYSFVYGADYYGIDDDNTSFVYRPRYTIALLNGLEQFPGADRKYDELRMHQMG
jgi:hypothetical protein